MVLLPLLEFGLLFDRPPLAILSLIMGSAVGRSFFMGQQRSKRGLVLMLPVMAKLTLLAGFECYFGCRAHYEHRSRSTHSGEEEYQLSHSFSASENTAH